MPKCKTNDMPLSYDSYSHACEFQFYFGGQMQYSQHVQGHHVKPPNPNDLDEKDLVNGDKYFDLKTH